MRLKDKVAIVTGGTSGIGEAASYLYAEEGALVTIVGYKHVNEGKAIVSNIEKKGGKAIFVQANVANEEDNKKIIEETVKAFGRIDTLFSNAAIMHYKTITDTSTEEWDNIMTVNVRSAFLVCKYAIPVMIKNGGGSIVIDASIDGIIGCPDEGPYIVSKGALIALMKSMAVDYGRQNIRVNAIAPGWIETPMTADQLLIPGNRERAAELNLLNKIGSPREVANAALFLASDEASFITGAVLTVDGGVTAGDPKIF
jgi:NAD(P)-dependent dehydrogenase (short-subunit alcohol dehydrogenase family)